MIGILNKIKSEFNIGNCAWLFLSLGLVLQTVVYIVTNDTELSFISGLLGVVSVILCSKRKMLFYVFGMAQLITFLIIVWQSSLYAKVAENIFYIITMVIGLFIWNNHYEEEKVQTRKISSQLLAIIFVGSALLSIIFGYILSLTDDAHPYIDSFTTIPAFVAQILMMLRYREQWIFWFLIDVGCIFLWIIVGNYCMVAQYIFWTANCIYGYLNWK